MGKARTRGNLFPLFLKLAGRRCVVVGAGKISEGKIQGLLSAGAHVLVVAPSATPQIEKWHSRGTLRWTKRVFKPRDLDRAFLVVAATSSNKVHRAIYREAKRRGVLCNIVDVPPLCDFYYPAVVRRGALQIAISTGGASPALAKRLRQQLEREFTEDYAGWLRHLARERKKIRAMKASPATKMQTLEAQVSREAFEEFRRSRRDTPSPRHRSVAGVGSVASLFVPKRDDRIDAHGAPRGNPASQ